VDYVLKRTSLIILISIILIITVPAAANADDTKLNINYGYGGEDNDGHSFGVEYLRNYRNKNSFGIGFFSKETDSEINYPENDYSVPHYDYYYAGTHISEELGMYLIYDYQIINSFSLIGKAGISIIEYTDVNISRATGWTYKGKTDTDHNTMYELGIAYNYNQKLDLGLSYNNRRGTVFNLSFKF